MIQLLIYGEMSVNKNLLRASFALHGTYANGRGKERASIIDVVPDDTQQTTAEKLNGVLAAMDEAQASPQAQGRWGAEVVLRAGDKALKDQNLEENYIASVCMSELDPSWVLTASSEQIICAAALLKTSRDVALRFHQFDIQRSDAD